MDKVVFHISDTKFAQTEKMIVIMISIDVKLDKKVKTLLKGIEKESYYPKNVHIISTLKGWDVRAEFLPSDKVSDVCEAGILTRAFVNVLCDIIGTSVKNYYDAQNFMRSIHGIDADMMHLAIETPSVKKIVNPDE